MWVLTGCPGGATLRGRAPVAQLDRASVYGTEGQRFESSRARCEAALQSGFFASRDRPDRQRVPNMSRNRDWLGLIAPGAARVGLRETIGRCPARLRLSSRGCRLL